MFEVGDHVRLSTGWTQMTVVATTDRTVVAAYGRVDPKEWKKRHRNPYGSPLSATKTRNHSGFVAWDGHPNQRSKKELWAMEHIRNFGARADGLTPNGHKVRGYIVGQRTNGDFILEGASDALWSVIPSSLKEVPSVEFAAVPVGKPSKKRHTYIEPENADIKVDDLLMSESGNLYRVVEYEPGDRDARREFKGKKLVTKELTE